MDQMSTSNRPSLDNFWMPFTANRQFKAAPRLLASAEGMYYTDIDGNMVLDGTAGLWCVNAGHGRKRSQTLSHASCKRWTLLRRFRWAILLHSTLPRNWQRSRPAGRPQNLIVCSSPARGRNRSIRR